MLKWDWKDYFIATTLGIISILAMFTLVDWTIEKDSAIEVSVALGFIGALLGGAISGGLTLLGVRLTIKEQRRSMSQEKIDKARYIKKKITSVMYTLDSRIKDKTYLDVSLIAKDAKRFLSIIDENSAILKETEFDFINTIETIQNWVIDIETYFERNIGKTDQEMRKDLNQINDFIQSMFRTLDDYFKKYT